MRTLGDVLHDMLYTLRMLRRAPAFAALVVATLAVGIGSNTAIFTVINAVLLRPLPYSDPDRLVWIVGGPPGPRGIAVPKLLELRARTRTLSHFGIDLPVMMTIAGETETVRLEGARISAAIVTMLDATPQCGRTFRADDERAGADAVILLSDGVWRRQFQRDPRIIGRSVIVDSRRYEVIGVMRRDFGFPNASTSFWIPFVWPSAGPSLLSRYVPIARIRPEVSVQTSSAEISMILNQSAEAEPPNGRSVRHPSSAPLTTNAPASVSPQSRAPGARLVSLQDALVAPIRPALLVLSGAASLVLLIACANVANLLLARSAARQREFAIRLALGSGRGRLVRQLLTESLLVSLISALVGTGLAAGALRLLRALSTGLARSDLGPPVALPRLEQVVIDPAALAFALVTALATGLIVALAPVLRHVRPWRLHRCMDGRSSRRCGTVEPAWLSAASICFVVNAAGVY